MTYDPVAYWQERGRDYRFTRDRRAEFECIRQALEGMEPRSVLEVGAGWGHVYRHLRKHDSPVLASFRMCDFVESMRDGCERETGIRPDQWDGSVLPYPDGSFDAVLSAACLQHVPPVDLDTVFAEHVRVARRWLFVTAFVASGRKLPAYDALHDYPALFAGHGLSVVEPWYFYRGRAIAAGIWLHACWLLEKS